MTDHRWVREAPPGTGLRNDKRAVLSYLDGGEVLTAARKLDVDRLDPSRGAVVPVTVETDGVWVWNGSLRYYFEQHDVWPEDDFVRHAVARNGVVAPVDDEVLDAVERWLQQQS